MKGFIFFFLSASVLFSCKKEEDEMSVVPEITFESISPANVRQYKDSVVIRIRYQDGDGDLGENNTSTPNAFVKDSRSSLTYTFRIRQLAPDENIPITGLLDIVVPATALTGSNASERADFSVYVKDRAGNTSNTVQTTAITIQP